MIQEYIGSNVDAFTEQDFLKIGRIYTSLRDGMAKKEDYFNVKATVATKSKAEEEFKSRKSKLTCLLIVKKRRVILLMRIPALSKENYYSNEIDRQYMSNSQYKSFLQCEVATMAKLNGEWTPSTSEALLFGQYVHAWLEGEQAFDEFKMNTPSLFTQKVSCTSSIS